jgi:RNA-directed DNA polymerase
MASRSPNDLKHPPTSRQDLYDRIKSSSKTSVIMEEMIRYGFWPKPGSTKTSKSADAARLKQVQRELAAAQTEASRTADIDKLLKAQRTQRMKESRERREETRTRRIAESKVRAATWQRRKAREIVYLGAGVSTGLSDNTADTAKLAAAGLPHFPDAAALATAMGVSLGELRFLAFHRKVSRVSHYRRFEIPKKTGGTRKISAPMPRLKAAQHWVLEHILSKVPLHEAAHGFRPGRSIVTNAAPHVGTGVVVNMDFKDFFPTITYRRVLGVLRGLGFSHAIATILTLLCTEPRITAVELDGQRLYVARGERFLPQGAPTSPVLTNILCRRLDRRLTGLSEKLSMTYTRYADDLTFSGADRMAVGTLLGMVEKIVTDEGLVLHPDKTRVMRRGRRHEVTGVVVNEKLSVDRRMVHRLRAVLHQIERSGPVGKHWGGHEDDVLEAVFGYANFVRMVDPRAGEPLVARARALLVKHA